MVDEKILAGGDLVLCNRPFGHLGTTYECRIKPLKNPLHVEYTDGFDTDRDAEDLSYIPLTREILEKNFLVRDWTPSRIAIHKDSIKPLLELSIDGWGQFRAYGYIKIKYVHQLQQLLRIMDYVDIANNMVV